MRTIITRSICGLLLLIAVSACAAPARVSQMTVMAEPTATSASSKFIGSLTVEFVAGGESTNPLWTSEVGNSEFREALKQSLLMNGYLADDQGAANYRLSAELLQLDQPMLGLSMTVTSNVDYTVREKESGTAVFRESIIAPYTAEFGDAFVGVERLRLANEGSIRENIKMFLEKLAKQN